MDDFNIEKLADMVIDHLREDAAHGGYGPYTIYTQPEDVGALSSALSERFEEGMVPYEVAGRDDLVGFGCTMVTTDHPSHEEAYLRENAKRASQKRSVEARYGTPWAGGLCVARRPRDEWIAENDPNPEIRALYAEQVRRKQAVG